MNCPKCGKEISDNASFCPNCEAQIWRYFTVTLEHGPAWNASLPLNEQKQFAEHSKYMGMLRDKGFVILGGPIRDGNRILLIFNTVDEKVVETWLADDPWAPIDVLKAVKIEPWQPILPAKFPVE